MRVSLIPDLGLRGWKYDLLWVGLFVVGLSGGLYFAGPLRHGPDNPAALTTLPPACLEPQTGAPKHDAPVASLANEVANTSAAIEPLPFVLKSADATSGDRNALAAPENITGPNQIPQLVSKGSFVVLGLEASVVIELVQHPGRLAALIRRGSVFAVPVGTAIKVLEREKGVLRVQILDGSMSGREGWVRNSQVKRRDRPAATLHESAEP